MSNQPGKQTDKLLSSLLGVVLEKRWKMFEGRAVQVVTILLLSTGEARGAEALGYLLIENIILFFPQTNSILRVFL